MVASAFESRFKCPRSTARMASPGLGHQKASTRRCCCCCCCCCSFSPCCRCSTVVLELKEETTNTNEKNARARSVVLLKIDRRERERIKKNSLHKRWSFIISRVLIIKKNQYYHRGEGESNVLFFSGSYTANGKKKSKNFRKKKTKKKKREKTKKQWQ